MKLYHLHFVFSSISLEYVIMHTNVTREYKSDNNVPKTTRVSTFPHRLKYPSVRPTKHLHIERRGKRAWRKYSRSKKKKRKKNTKREKKVRDTNSPARHFLIRPVAKSPKRCMRLHYFGNYANNSFAAVLFLRPRMDGE